MNHLVKQSWRHRKALKCAIVVRTAHRSEAGTAMVREVSRSGPLAAETRRIDERQ
jgi:hypothetical protein